MAKTLRAVDLEPLERLEQKVKLLVAMIGRLRTDQARLAEENQRLPRELDVLRGRLAETDGQSAEFTALKEERELVRTRVAEMLAELEALNL
jgi:regulator of replication initiation timing